MLGSKLGDLYLEKFQGNTRLERIWKIAQVDFKKRYYNDKFGLLWALINPLTQIAIYYFVFTRVFKRNEDNFVFFLFAGLIIWLAFSQGTNLALRVLTTKKYLTENIQFNWIDLYTSHMISIMMGLLFNFAAYIVILYLAGLTVGAYWYLFPVILLTWFLITAALSMILGILRPTFDDIVHIWSICIMIGFWVSGIFFSGTELFAEYMWLAHLNPFVGILLNTRACLLEGNALHMNLLIENLVFAIILYGIAVFIFKKFAKKAIEKL